MSYLIDTDICSAHLKNQRSVTNRLLQYSAHLHLSVITVGELLTWALRANAPPRRLQGVQSLFGEVAILPVDESVAYQFGRLRAELLDSGRPVPEMDLLIASTAIAHNLTLVTYNQKDFIDIPGLNLEDWLSP